MVTEYNQEIYNNFEAGEHLSVPSYMGMVPNKALEIAVPYLENAVMANPEFTLISVKDISDNDIAMFEVELFYREQKFTALLSTLPIDKEYLTTLSLANNIKDEELQATLEQDYYIDISTMFSEDALESYLFQLKLMNTIVPHALLGLDFSAMTVFSINWLKMIVEANIPPAPRYLYSIHAVYDEVAGKKDYWLHTHGLLRCGSIELEVVDLHDGAQQIFDLLTYTANLFIEKSYNEKEKFQVGYDGMGLYMSWVKWEEALEDLAPTMLGGVDEREGEDNPHVRPSGILYAVEDNNEMISPEIYAKTLEQNPIFFISDKETNRMRQLAISQWGVFEKTFEKHGAKQPEEKKSFFGKLFNKKEENKEPEWSFLVKLGLTVDEAEKETDREHLWFAVKEIKDGKVTGELTNQPYWIAALKQGDVKTYPVEEVLTDWLIYSPDMTYTPDSAYLLK